MVEFHVAGGRAHPAFLLSLFAELAHVGDGRGRSRDRLGGIDLRRLVCVRGLVPRQQNEHEPDPKRQAKQKKHLATPAAPRLPLRSIRKIDPLHSSIDRKCLIEVKSGRIREKIAPFDSA